MIDKKLEWSLSIHSVDPDEVHTSRYFFIMIRIPNRTAENNMRHKIYQNNKTQHKILIRTNKCKSQQSSFTTLRRFPHPPTKTKIVNNCAPLKGNAQKQQRNDRRSEPFIRTHIKWNKSPKSNEMTEIGKVCKPDYFRPTQTSRRRGKRRRSRQVFSFGGLTFWCLFTPASRIDKSPCAGERVLLCPDCSSDARTAAQNIVVPLTNGYNFAPAICSEQKPITALERRLWIRLQQATRSVRRAHVSPRVKIKTAVSGEMVALCDSEASLVPN